MKIVIAPDSFKESLSALQVATALEDGIHKVLTDVECCKLSMADGGEGTVTALVTATGGSTFRECVHGPLGHFVNASYGISGDGRTAVVEMAAASGLSLLAVEDRDPARTTTYGTGELIMAASKRGARRIIVGLGGSATNDGGAGMGQALGIKFHDQGGTVISEHLTGGTLGRIASISMADRDPAVGDVEILVACDVDNPLVGRCGASAVFASQKGATPAQIKSLERNLRHYGRLLESTTGFDVLDLPGAGAAGGLGAGLVAFAGGEIKSGVDIVIEAVRLERHLDGADLVITGEGRIDGQTIYGKVPVGVARLAKGLGIPVIAVGGSLADDAAQVFARGIDALEGAVARDMSLTEALTHSERNLRAAGERIARWIVLGRCLRL